MFDFDASSQNLRRNILLLSVLQGLNYVTPLLTIPHLVRALGPSHFGRLAFAQALTLYFDVFTEFGFNLSATREVASNCNRPEQLRQTFWSTMSARAVLLVVSGVALGCLVQSVPQLKDCAPLFGATFLTVVGTAVFPVWLFQGLQQLKWMTVAQAASRILTVPAIYLFVHREEDDVVTGVIQGAAAIAPALLLARWIWRRLGGRLYRPNVAELVAVFRAGWRSFVSNSTLLLSTSSTAVVLGFVAGNAEVGYFSAAEKLIKALSSLLTPVTQALYPHLASLKAESAALALACIRRNFRVIVALGFTASAATLVFAGPVSRLVFGLAFQRSIVVLEWLSPLPALYALVNLLGMQTMMVFRMDAALTRVLLMSALASLLIAAVMAHFLGAAGAAAAAVFGTLMAVVALAMILHRRGLAVWRGADAWHHN